MNKKVIAIIILFLIILIIGGLTIYYICNSENYILTIREMSDNGIYAEQHIVTESTYPSDTTQKFKDNNGNTLGISELEVGTQIIDEYTNYVCNIEKIENESNRIILTFSYNELYYFNLLHSLLNPVASAIFSYIKSFIRIIEHLLRSFKRSVRAYADTHGYMQILPSKYKFMRFNCKTDSFKRYFSIFITRFGSSCIPVI